MKWIIHNDGSFDLSADNFLLKGCYPAFDGLPVRVSAIEYPDDQSIHYRASEFTLKLQLKTENSRAVVSSTVQFKSERLPVSVSLIHNAFIEGASKYFWQDGKSGIDSGFVDVDNPKQEQASSLFSALIGSNESILCLECHDNRDFLQRSLLHKPTADCRRATIEYGFLTEEIPFAGELRLPDLIFREDRGVWDNLQRSNKAIAEAAGARRTFDDQYVWCSWYYNYYNLTHDDIKDYLKGFREGSAGNNLHTFQIDAGYSKRVGDWLDPHPERFPDGLQKSFEEIDSAGFRPGIWIAPFMVGSRSQVAINHPEWLLKDNSGENIKTLVSYDDRKFIAYKSEEHYVLDSSHPEAFEHIRNLFRTLYAWGARYFKTDFIYTVARPSHEVQRFKPGKTWLGYAVEVFDMIREEIGEDSFLMGCLSPLFPLLGNADGVRIGGDSYPGWRNTHWEHVRTEKAYNAQYLNKVWFLNDADALFFREFHTHLDEDESYAEAIWVSILGGVINTSDPLHLICNERLKMWHFCRPAPAEPAHLPFWGTDNTYQQSVAVRKYPELGAWGVVFLNEKEHPVTERFRIHELCGEDKLYVYDWQPGSSSACGLQEELSVELPSHNGRAYYLTAQDAPPPADLTMGGWSSAIANAG